MKPIPGQAGATLVELVISTVIISIVASGVMMLIAQTSRASADPIIRIQAGAIAQAYMEEILAQSLNDPDSAETGGAEAGESRATYDDVSDYHGLADTSGAIDQNGNPVAGLGAYNVAVTVSAATLGAYPAKRIAIDVTFDGDADFSLPLTSYRLN